MTVSTHTCVSIYAYRQKTDLVSTHTQTYKHTKHTNTHTYTHTHIHTHTCTYAFVSTFTIRRTYTLICLCNIHKNLYSCQSAHLICHQLVIFEISSFSIQGAHAQADRAALSSLFRVGLTVSAATRCLYLNCKYSIYCKYFKDSG